MAKKRRKSDKEPEEEYEFRPPEFDEKQFLLKEISDTLVVVFTVVYAVALGVVAGLLCITDRAFVGPSFLVVVAGMISLPYVYPIFRIDTKAFQKRNWLGNIGTFFFTFLAIWILMLNQPFADLAKPSISDITVWVQRPGNITAVDYKFNSVSGVYQWTPRYGETLGNVIKDNYSLNLTAKVVDNDHLKSVLISINGGDYLPMTFEAKGRWGYAISASDSRIAGQQLSIKISAEDNSGNQQVLIPSGSIPVGA